MPPGASYAQSDIGALLSRYVPAPPPPPDPRYAHGFGSKDGGQAEQLALYRGAPAGDFLRGRRLEGPGRLETYTWRNMLRGYGRFARVWRGDSEGRGRGEAEEEEEEEEEKGDVVKAGFRSG